MISIFIDLERNRNNPKSAITLVFFRLASRIAKTKREGNRLWYFGLPYLILYRILVEWLLGTELPPHTVVGKGLVIEHGQSLVINDDTIIGKNVTLRHNTTIGCKTDELGNRSRSPRIGDFADIGANVVVIGDISIGIHAVIGAGSVVVKDVPDYAIVAGNPAKVIRIKGKNGR